ncbi:MAG: penicillin-binding transpeptidase domain-containing protein, partial [Pseudomonadota bacterium]
MIRGLPIKDHWSEQRLFVTRSIAAALIATALLLFVVGRLVVLQVLNHEHFVDLSHGNRVRIEPVQPTRGLIFDRNGELLAENLPAYQLELVLEQVPDLDDTLARLTADGLLRPEDDERVRRLIASKRRFDAVPLRYRLAEEEVARFSVHRQDFPGVDIRARLARHYPLGATAVHAIGYVASISPEDLKRLDPAAYSGTTHVGKVGIEKAYEDRLHGAAGHQQVLVNAQGRALQVTQGAAPLPGADLFLTLDVSMQIAAEQALGDRRGAVVAIDPANGDILVLASAPGYDPNPFGEGLSSAEYRALSTDRNKPLFNRALRGNYPPGSTIKPM